jgi:hypothetical protein
MPITTSSYGTLPSGEEVTLFTITSGKCTAKIITFGGVSDAPTWLPACKPCAASTPRRATQACNDCRDWARSTLWLAFTPDATTVSN